MASCLVPEFPAVLVALEHLKELEKQLREDEVSFAAEGSIHLKAIAEAVSELEATRRTTHEHLEVETIENSKLRHQIKTMSDRMNEDILADRAAARATNVEEVEELRRKLNLFSQIREEYEKKLQEMLHQHKLLQIEKEQTGLEHRGVIASLNTQISLKYKKQQLLEKKLEEIEELRSNIAAMEQERVSLLQSMALKRETFSEDKHNVNIEVGETIGMIKQERKAISNIRQELENIKEKKEEADTQLNKLSEQMVELESSLASLTATRSDCERQLQNKVKQSQELNQKLEAQKKIIQELEEAFNLLIQNLQKEIKATEEKTLEFQDSALELKDSLAYFCKVFNHKHEEELEIRADHQCASLELERTRLQLEERITTIVKLSRDIKEMERQIEELREEDRINRRVFASKREQLLKDLEAIKSDIDWSKKELEKLTALLAEAKLRQDEYKDNMMSDIYNTRKRYEELLQEEAALLRLYPESGDADVLKKRIACLQKEHSKIQNACQQDLKQIITESEKLRGRIEEKQRELEEQKKILEEVEAKWSEEKTRCEELNALNSVLNQRKFDLEQSIQDTENHTKLLLEPREEMKASLEKLQESYSDMQSKENAELSVVEVNIYEQSMMLEQVETENSRLHLCIGKMTEDLSTSRQETEQYQQQVQDFNLQAEALFKDLQEGWNRDISVVKDAERSDEELLVVMRSQKNHLKTKNQQLIGISTLLHQLMLEFSKRLGDKAMERWHN